MKAIFSLAIICLALAGPSGLAQTARVAHLAGNTNRASFGAVRARLQGASSNSFPLVPTIGLPNPAPGVATLSVTVQAGRGMQPLDSPPPCASVSGLVGWWRGEGDALDFLAANNGSLQGNAGFEEGVVGQAFSLDGTNGFVSVPSAPGLNPSTAISVEAWVYPRLPFGTPWPPILKKAGDDGETDHGYSLELAWAELVVFWVYVDGDQGWIPSPAAELPADQWSHVVGVYDGGTISLYVNGVSLDIPTDAPGQIVPSGNDLQIGHDSSNADRYFNGLIDEPTIYNMALSAEQVQVLYEAGSAGKCTAPVIQTQPQAQRVPVGADASLSVVAAGGPPLSYQWVCNGNALSGATGSGLTLPNVQVSSSGIYSVMVSSPYGQTASDDAVLTVYVPVCTEANAALAGWWQGEGSAVDFLGMNHGTLQGGASFAAGAVGQAFDLDGSNQYVHVAHNTSLSPANAITVEAWVYPRPPFATPWPPILKKAGEESGQEGGYSLELYGPDAVTFWVCLDAQGWTPTEGACLPPYTWSHIAGVYDGAIISLYLNGVLVGASTSAPGQIAPSVLPLQIGHDPSNANRYFNGLIDEASVYHTALTAEQISAIYAAGVGGKCVPPAVTSPPASQSVTAGNSATLQVIATGRTLNYQWYHNGDFLAGETQSTLFLPNVQDGDTGTYTVQVWNASGSVTSDGAVVTLSPAVAVPVPAGVFAWWRGEDHFKEGDPTVEDMMRNNPGMAHCYLQQPGKVGAAFGFIGIFESSGTYLLIPARPANEGGINSSAWEGFTVEGWFYPYNDVSIPRPIMEQWNGSDNRITLSLGVSAPGSLELTYFNSGQMRQLCSLPGVLRPNAFQHIALAYKNHQGTVFVKIYVNGQLVAENQDALEMALGANDFYFGSSPSHAGIFHVWEDVFRGFDGTMDELTVYSRALAASEILGIYNAGSAGKIPPCTPAPGGSVSWWQGEGDGADVYASNPAIVPENGVTFTPGHTGQAFTFDGTGSVRVPASASLNVGAGGGFTLEAWIKPDSVTAAQPLLEWHSGQFTGVALWLSAGGGLTAAIQDATLMDYLIYGGTLSEGVFQHVALTYNAAEHKGRLFLNGSQAGEVDCVLLLPVLTMYDLYFGFSPADDLGTGTQFTGQIDEVGLCGRALSDVEIRSLYTAGGGGKCGLPPNILTEPQSQAAYEGNNVVFTVVATGTSLTYQWSFNDGSGAQPIADATSSALALMNLQAAQAGTYTVTAENALGSVTSLGATLIINLVGSGTPPEITSQPQSASLCEGEGFSLTVGVGNHSGSLSYQWCKNTINISGATGSSYAISQVSSSAQGTYSVGVYDSAGHITSADAVMAVHPHPTAALSIVGNSTIHPGGTETAEIQVLLTGTGAWTLRWSDGYTEAVPANGNPHHREVAPSTTTTYSLVALSDNYCAARPADLGLPVEVKVDGPNLDWPMRAGFTPLAAGTYNNYTFGGDMMFLVDGEVNLTGTTTFEGGTVVYFAPLSQSTARIIISGSVVCHTAPYKPVTFTSSDMVNYIWYFDDPAAPMTDYYGQGLSLQTTNATVLKHFRFFNLGCGVSLDSATACTLYNCQFADCDTAIAQTDAGASLNLYNVLFCDDTTVIALGAAAQAPQINFQHITVDNCGNFASGLPAPPAGTWIGKNSLLVNVLDAGSIPSNLQRDVNNCPTISSSSGVFVTAGDGSHYLADDTYRAHGTLTGLDSTLVSELPQKTTRPPMTLPLDFETSGSITLSPQVPRYSGGAPDLGYQYEVLDYTLSDVIVRPGGQITVLPGTAIGIRYDWVPGFQLLQGATLASEGTPTRPNTFVAVSAVQEGPFPQLFWYPGFQISFIPCYWPEVVADPEYCPDYNAAGDPPPALSFRFSNLYLSAGFSHHVCGGMAMPSFYGLLNLASYDSAMFLSLRDCAVHGGWLHLGEPYWGVIPPVFQPEWWDPWWEPFCGPPIPGSVTWVNNLFDRVNISLDPDTGPAYWGGPYPHPTIDLCVTATNNLFQGGWLFMEPTAASAGDWVFQNNLFDQTVFAQDANQPLNQDYNGYWQCASGELLSGQMDKLKPDAAHDVLLDAAPPYASSYLGGYYLPDTLPGTPQLFGAGSCSPADVGLYHYTTCAAQTKEGEITPPHNVNIGLHYIAVETSGAHAGQPKDSDTDGIPDYVEDANGNGDPADVTEGRETSPTLVETATGTHDSVSAIYDDIDLDGDGMVGRIEKALHPANPQPLVSDNPLALTEATEIQSGVFTFELPISYDLLTTIGSLRLNREGMDVPVQSYARATDGTSTLLIWNTTYDPPGLHFCQPRLTLNGTGVDTAILSGLGCLVPFYSDNVCRFFESDALFDDNGAYLDAQLPVPNASYSIHIYDPSTSPRTLLKTIPTKTTSSGMIQEDWDLTCDQGPSPFAGSAFDAVFDITLLDQTSSTPTAHGTPTKRHGKIITTEQGNGFDVAYMYTPKDNTLAASFDHGPVWIGMQGVVDTLTQPSWVWPDNINYYESSFDIFTSPGCVFGWPGYVTSTATITSSLFPSMSDGLTKNVYCYAHGTANSLQNYAGDVKITAGDVAALLGNQGLVPGAVIPNNPYRFVFLDGCSTASDNQWRHAFGIMSLGPVDQAARSILGPQAFIGWSTIKSAWLDGIPENGNLDVNQSKALQSAYTATLQLFFFEWMNGEALLTCMRHACDPTRVQCPLPIKKVEEITIKSPFASPSFTVANKYPAYIYIYGHPGLTRNGLDSEADRVHQFDAPDNRH